MTTNNVRQTPNITDPTDLSAIDNISAVVVDGYGGPHSVFDKDHYKAQMRLENKLVEFKANQGAIAGHGYTWAISLVAYNDDNSSELIEMPPIDVRINSFLITQLQLFFNQYQPKQLYFVYLNLDVAIEDFEWLSVVRPPAPAPVPTTTPAPTPPPSPSGFAKPRTAIYYLGRPVDSPTDQALAARYNFVVLGLWAGMSPSRLQATITGIKSFNPNVKLAQYTMLQEMRDAAPTDPDYSLWQALNVNNWWLRNAAGDRTQWTILYSAYNINITAWPSVDADGHNWQQVKASFDTDHIYANMIGLDYAYLDGFDAPVSDGDYKHIGTNQSRTDPEIVTAYRNGYVDYANRLRNLNPGLKIVGNSASIDAPEYSGQIEGVLRECLMGKSWSLETWAGWDAMMNSYRAALAHTKAPHDVVFGACSPVPNPAFYRYGIASALLEDGYFAFSENGYQTFTWYDESDAPLGTADEAPPTSPTPSGIWTRRYTNGIVLVNPSKTLSASIDIGPGYKHISGTIDPTVNNGLPERIITLAPRHGLIMIKI